MPILGAHMSIAGGYFRAVHSAKNIGCDCVQIFTKNNNQWRAKELTDEDAEKFRNALTDTGIENPLSHASYLINLASPKDELRNKSIDGMVVELQRASKLGIPYVVMHPGSFTTSSEDVGLKTIARSLDEIHRQTAELTSQVLLENTADQGSNLGWKFEHLAEIIGQSKNPERIGVCFDTCHAFAAGYSMEDEEAYFSTISELDDIVGLEKLKAFHLNDSKKPFGSRKDRHEHIGRGEMGIEPFRLLLNDPRMGNVPMYLETEKGEEDGIDLDAMNLETLRSLIQ